MNHLLRSHAPISAAGWELLDHEARERASAVLAMRKLVDFSDPRGWEHSATNLGRTRPLVVAGLAGVSALQRRVLALVELRADFELAREELRDADRGAADVDLGPLDAAAVRIAEAENAAIFAGLSDAIAGIAAASPHAAEPLGTDPEGYPTAAAGAVDQLIGAGVGGPYALALGREQYRFVLETLEPSGYPLLEHLRTILEGPIARAHGVEGAVVISLRGGDFCFESGQDLAIGYDSHDGASVRLYLQESFSFHIATPEAAVVLDP